MPAQHPIPPLLQPYLKPPTSSLTLLTSTLGASKNWLVLCFIFAALKSQDQLPRTGLDSRDLSLRNSHGRQNEDHTKVVLVSWLRNISWWNDAGRRLGLDFSKVKIVDALSAGLGLSKPSSTAIEGVEKAVLEAISPPSGGTPTSAHEATDKPVLILDGIDLLLAATSISETTVNDMILGIRELVDATILTVGADRALVDSPDTPLELKHAAFLMGMMHQASLIMSVRGLDTGVAKDVSGVLRITKGAGLWNDGTMDGEREEGESLFFVGADGRARVFQRGT